MTTSHHPSHGVSSVATTLPGDRLAGWLAHSYRRPSTSSACRTPPPGSAALTPSSLREEQHPTYQRLVRTGDRLTSSPCCLAHGLTSDPWVQHPLVVAGHELATVRHQHHGLADLGTRQRRFRPVNHANTTRAPASLQKLTRAVVQLVFITQALGHGCSSGQTRDLAFAFSDPGIIACYVE